MLKDQFDNPVTTDNSTTVDAIDRFCHSYISYGTDFGVIFEVADQDPDCALANAHAAFLATMLETPGCEKLADTYLKKALVTAPAASEREQLNIAAMEAVIKGDIAAALQHRRKLAMEYPGDLFSAKVGQINYFNLGKDAEMLWLADQVMDRHMDNAYAHGMRAFGFEQTSQFEKAEEEGRRATEMQRCEPWAHHAVAHVMLSQGRIDEGLNWMNGLSDQWNDCNSFMYTHNWWHIAVFHIDNDDYQAALDLFDEHIWGINKPFSQDQVNAISLLWRLELVGFDVGDRWQDIADHVAERYLVNDQPFIDMHYVFALARADRADDVSNLMEKIERHSETVDTFVRPAWTDVAVPACKAFVDVAKGDHKAALINLVPAMARMQDIGGSHAQRDLFEQVRLDSLMKCNRNEEAVELIEKRLDFRGTVKSDWRLLKAAAEGAGLGNIAAKADARL